MADLTFDERHRRAALAVELLVADPAQTYGLTDTEVVTDRIERFLLIALIGRSLRLAFGPSLDSLFERVDRLPPVASWEIVDLDEMTGFAIEREGGRFWTVRESFPLEDDGRDPRPYLVLPHRRLTHTTGT